LGELTRGVMRMGLGVGWPGVGGGVRMTDEREFVSELLLLWIFACSVWMKGSSGSWVCDMNI